MDARDIISSDLQDNAARRHISKILHWHVNKFIASSQPGLAKVKDRNGATIINKERVKGRWAEHFEDLLNQNGVAGKDTVENEKVTSWM